MKIQKTKINNELHWKLIAETTEEKCILGGLRNHYFFGREDDNTFPEYDGIESEEIDDSLYYVTAIKFKCKKFNDWELC